MDSAHGSDETSIDVVDQAGTPIQLVLKARGGIRGRLVDAFGTGSGRAMIRLLAVPAGGEVDEKALAESDRYARPRGDRGRSCR